MLRQPPSWLVPALVAAACLSPACREGGDADADADADAGPGLIVDHTGVDPSVVPAEHLAAARALDVIFGHQSVGENVVEGLEALGSDEPDRYGLALERDPAPSWFEALGGFGHFAVGENGDPWGKVEHFGQVLDRDGYAGVVEVAMMKLCYVDFDGGQDPDSVFEAYAATMRELEAAHPAVTFVYWTAPVTTWGSAGQGRFNRLVRSRCAATGCVLFDIADIEGHDPEGRPVSLDGDQAMHDGYTDDGGHLDDAGRRRLAGALLVLLARIAGWDGT